MIISFNSRLKNFNSVFRFFISVFMLKISIFRLCMIILCHFSSFLMLLTSKTCFHIALCISKTSAMYFFKIIRTMLFLFCILTIMMTIRSIFVFFNVLFIESRIFIVFKVQFSFLKLTMNFLSRYDISCDFDENFLMIRVNNEIYLYEMLTTNFLQAMLVRRAEQSHRQSSNSAICVCYAYIHRLSIALRCSQTTRSHDQMIM